MLQLHHANIVQSILLPVVDETTPLIVMELLPLGDLKHFVLNR